MSESTDDKILAEIARRQRETQAAVEATSPKQIVRVIDRVDASEAAERRRAELLKREELRELDKQHAIRESARASLWRLRGGRYQNCRLSNFERHGDAEALKSQNRAVAELTEYAAAVKERITAGEGLLLYGPAGTGKDHLVAAVATAAIDAGATVAPCYGPEFFRRIVGTFQRDDTIDGVLSRYRGDVLWLSDPAPDEATKDVRLSSTLAGALAELVETYYRDRKPIWLTTNAESRDKLAAAIGWPLTTRLLEGALTIHCNWANWRKPKG